MAADPQHEMKEFDSLIEQLHREVRKLKQNNEILHQENERFRAEIEKLRESKDLFSDLPENQRLVLKKQIAMLIERIDSHVMQS